MSGLGAEGPDVVRGGLCCTMSALRDGAQQADIVERLFLELKTKEEELEGVRASLVVAKHVIEVTDAELQQQRQLAEKAAAAHRASSSEVALHKGQVDGNLSDLKSLRKVVQQLLDDQESAAAEHAATVAAAQASAELYRQQADAQKTEFQAALDTAEHRHRLALRSAELTREHLTRQLACAGSGDLQADFVVQHTEQLQAAYERCDRRQVECRRLLAEKEQAVREAREQARLRASEQVDAIRTELEMLRAAHAAELSEVEGTHRAQLKHVHELKAQLVQQLAEAGERSASSEPDADLAAETASLKAELADTKAELARCSGTIQLGARQSEAFSRVLKRSRADAAQDRQRAARYKEELEASRMKIADLVASIGPLEEARRNTLRFQQQLLQRVQQLEKQQEGTLQLGEQHESTVTRDRDAELAAAHATATVLRQQLRAMSASRIEQRQKNGAEVAPAESEQVLERIKNEQQRGADSAVAQARIAELQQQLAEAHLGKRSGTSCRLSSRWHWKAPRPLGLACWHRRSSSKLCSRRTWSYVVNWESSNVPPRVRQRRPERP